MVSTIEANIMRSFAEVRKEIAEIKEQLGIMSDEQNSLEKKIKSWRKK